MPIVHVYASLGTPSTSVARGTDFDLTISMSLSAEPGAPLTVTRARSTLIPRDWDGRLDSWGDMGMWLSASGCMIALQVSDVDRPAFLAAVIAACNGLLDEGGHAHDEVEVELVPLPAGIQGVHALAAEAREFTLARLSGEVHRLSRTKEYSKWDHVRLLRDALHQLVRPSTGSVNQRARLRSWRDGSE